MRYRKSLVSGCCRIGNGFRIGHAPGRVVAVGRGDPLSHGRWQTNTGDMVLTLDGASHGAGAGPSI